MGRYTAGGVGRDIFAGAVAGVAAIWVADQLDKAIYKAGSPESIRKSEAARPGGMDPAHVLAKRAADAVGADLGDAKSNVAGHTIHYGIAAGLGALYGLLRGATPWISGGRGALFGIGMFVLQDKIGNTALGLAANPLKYPMRDHARGAATYTVFGVLTDLGARLIAPWRDVVVIEQGPPLSERLDHGRQYLVEHRDALYGQGLNYAGRLAEQASAYLPEVDTAELARRGRRYAQDAAETVQTHAGRAQSMAADARARLSGIDAAGLARSGRREAERLASTARGYVPEVPSGLSRALQRLFG